MKDRWIEVSPDAGDKQDARFDAWLSAENIPFESPEAEAAYKERITLIRDAVRLKAPKRIPRTRPWRRPRRRRRSVPVRSGSQ